MNPTWTSPCGRATLYLGDCLQVLPTLAAGSVDLIVTDPPYGPGFFAIAKRRIQQAIEDYALFQQPAPKPEQAEMNFAGGDA